MISYKLKRPIEFDGATISELRFRSELCAGDLRGVKLSELELTENVIKVAGRLTGQTEAALLKMGAADYVEVSTMIAGFFEAGPGIGSAG